MIEEIFLFFCGLAIGFIVIVYLAYLVVYSPW